MAAGDVAMQTEGSWMSASTLSLFSGSASVCPLLAPITEAAARVLFRGPDLSGCVWPQCRPLSVRRAGEQRFAGRQRAGKAQHLKQAMAARYLCPCVTALAKGHVRLGKRCLIAPMATGSITARPVQQRRASNLHLARALPCDGRGAGVVGAQPRGHESSCCSRCPTYRES